MFPFELLSMPDRTFNSKGLLTYLAAKAETRSGVLAEPALHYTVLKIVKFLSNLLKVGK